MEKLNKGEALPLETRLKLYKEMLSIFHSTYPRGNEGFCFPFRPVLDKMFNLEPCSVYIDKHKYLLPELWKLRTRQYPKRGKLEDRGYWYNDNEERIEALEKAIEIVSSLLNGPANTNT